MAEKNKIHVSDHFSDRGRLQTVSCHAINTMQKIIQILSPAGLQESLTRE